MQIEVTLSVHQLVDFLLRRGSIDSRIYNMETMQEGTRIHLRYQNMQDGTYESEVGLECNIEFDQFLFHLQGRADGIIHSKDYPIIDEIKSTNDDLNHFHEIQGDWHLGQAICYAYMYALKYGHEEMGVRLTYISQNDGSTLIKNYYFNFALLEKRVYELIEKFVEFYSLLMDHKEKRNQSAKELKFPFDEYRKGQKDVAKYVYNFAKNGGTFLFEAPTGTGKTMSTLFPSIKTFGDDFNEKIFYFSAKQQAKSVAFDAMKLLSRKGLFAHSIVISSKEQMCQCDEMKCNPDDCPFAKNYYDKINTIVEQILINERCIDKEIIFKYALFNGICPFECQLDVSTYCDVIICDYNYLFDPVVYLKRFFDNEKTPYFALIDEAHNLFDRTKEMYTISISYEMFNELKKSFRRIKALGLKRSLKKLMLFIDELVLNIEEKHYIFENDFPKKFYSLLENLQENMQDILKDNLIDTNDAFNDVFKAVNRFLKIHEYLNDEFVTYVEKEDDIKFYIRCIDASNQIKSGIDKLRGAIFFSATLTPIEYYVNTLGGSDDTPYLRLPSPFEKENLCLLVRGDISTKYKDRESSYHAIADSIKAVVSSKIGNYLVFFSSYQYLSDVLNCYKVDDEELIIQQKDMTPKDRDDFLSSFKENPEFTTVGFAVLGGSFSEGIDLVSTRLIGAIIVGVGLPMVSFERDLIRKYYDGRELNGFDYAYTNPGKNKVMQAAGRVIRTSTDRGVVLLIDQRFTQYNYRDLFKTEWSHYKRVNSTEQIKNHLSLFWNKDEN